MIASGCAFSGSELFDAFKDKNLLRKVKKAGYTPNNILSYSIYLILKDVIENNNEFQLPVNYKAASIYLNRISGKDFAKARKNGAFKDVDLLGSNFQGLRPILEMKKGWIENRKEPIYIDHRLKDSLLNVNNNIIA